MVNHRGTENTEELTGLSCAVIGAAIEVHRHLGPGLLESIYEAALHQELRLRGLDSKRQVVLPIVYKGAPLGPGIRIDLLVSSRLVVEVKSVERLADIHRAQLLTYLKLTRLRLGLLINFNVEVLRTGVRRVIN